MDAQKLINKNKVESEINLRELSFELSSNFL